MMTSTTWGQPVCRSAIVDGHRWWARVRQFRSSASVEAWDDAGFDGEAVVPTADVFGLLCDAWDDGIELPTASAVLLRRVARTFISVPPLPAVPVDRRQMSGAVPVGF